MTNILTFEQFIGSNNKTSENLLKYAEYLKTNKEARENFLKTKNG